MRVKPLDIDKIDTKPFKVTKEEIQKRLLTPNTICFYEKDICLLVGANRNGNIYLDVVEVVDTKKHLKAIYKELKELLNLFGTSVFYLEIDRKNPHIKDMFYKNSEKIFENDKKTIYRRSIK